MFKAESARIFALPPGCDFSSVFLQGLRHRLRGQPPEAIAKVEIFVNTERTKRRIVEILQAGPSGLLPRLRVITDLAKAPLVGLDLPPPISPLRRRLELCQTISALLDHEPELAPRMAIFDLADSLAGLMDEMHGEAVSVEQVLNLDISPDFSAHWERSLTFLKILAPYFADQSEPDTDARQRLVVDHLTRVWAKAPPEHPVIVAGSTGSRGATAAFMQAVAALPQGAIVLPGFDFDLPAASWQTFENPYESADHSHAGFHKLLARLSLDAEHVRPWADVQPFNPARNRLVSLAMRPAPVTDQWLTEGPKLPPLATATDRMTMIEAPSQREEALAIALRLRAAAQKGEKATLISPDRTLTRQVTAALTRWKILPDDSAGRPLSLTPPGIFLRLTSALLGQRLTSENLLILLKHPLTHTGAGRGQHLLWTRDLELQVLRGGAPFVDFQMFREWADKYRGKSVELTCWIKWLDDIFNPLHQIQMAPLSDIVARHRTCAEALAKGASNGATDSGLWAKDAGIKALEIFTDLEQNADAGGTVTSAEYTALFRSVFGRADVRQTITAHPHITIWGTLESRVQGADVVILGGLNEGVWPGLPAPDPWLNRPMRHKAGLLLPERQIGLSAHDFQQAIAAPEVFLTRATRLGDAPAVASRWVIRLANLLAGLGDDGKNSLSNMRARGRVWLDLAAKLEEPESSLEPALRPSPVLPDHLHPRKLSVTKIKVLIRDPYAIYAQYVLKLRKLDPLRRQPDAMLRGQAIHTVLEDFVHATLAGLPPDAAQKLQDVAQKVFARDVPWPATRRLWLARLARVADKFTTDEVARRQRAVPVALETKGVRHMAQPDFTLTGTADRIDRMPDESLIIYDYKTGAVPSALQIKAFDKQLPLEAAIAQAGGFAGVEPSTVSGLEYVGLGSGAVVSALTMDDDLVNQTWADLGRLIAAYRAGKVGYTARARMEKHTDQSDYDHLSRRDEWEEGDIAIAQDVT